MCILDMVFLYMCILDVVFSYMSILDVVFTYICILDMVFSYMSVPDVVFSYRCILDMVFSYVYPGHGVFIHMYPGLAPYSLLPSFSPADCLSHSKSLLASVFTPLVFKSRPARERKTCSICLSYMAFFVITSTFICLPAGNIISSL